MNPTPTTNTVLYYLCHWINQARAESSSDADLLRCFTQGGDEEAFALVIDRHGPMVHGAARRIIGDEHLAEDVFQATFLTLFREAKHIRRADALPAWLHSTACRLALTALRKRRRRQRVENEAVPRPTVSPCEAASSQEQLVILDEELRRLPERFRLPLVLCCLEGRSQADAAVMLGWTPGSVKGRLERGRERLRERLVRRGVTVAVAAALPMLVRPILAAPLRDAVLRAARTGASMSPAVSALVHAACKPLFIYSWKAVFLISILGLAGTGAGVATRLARPQPAAQSAFPPAFAENERSSHRPAQAPDALPHGALARLGASPLRIGNAAFALTPDERSIVTITAQGLVRRFDAKSGRLLERRQITERDEVDPMGQFHAQLSKDGRIAALQEGSDSGCRVSIWDLTTGERLFLRKSIEGRNTGRFQLSPDGKWLAIVEYLNSSRTTVLRVFDVKTGAMSQLGGLDFNVYDILFSADGKRVVVSQTSAERGGGSTFACFDVPAGKQLWKRPRKGQTCALSPDGKTLVSSTFEGSFQIIETEEGSGKAIEHFQPYHKAHPNIRLVIAPDHRTVIMNYFGELLLWDLHAGKEIRRFAVLPKNFTSGYGPDIGALTRDSRTIVTNVGHLQRWDLTTGKPFFAATPDEGLAGPIEYLAFTPNGKELFASSWGITSGRWDVASRKRITITHERYGHQLIRTPSGLRALQMESWRKPHEIMLIDPLTGRRLSTMRWIEPKEVTINGLRAFTLTANGKALLFAHGQEPGEPQQKLYVTACDAASGRRLARFSVPGRFQFERSPFSPCGRWAAIGEKVYHVGSGTALFAPAGEPGERLVAWDCITRGRGSVWFSEDGRLMAGLLHNEGEKSTANDTLAVWELASGAVLARYPKARFIAQAAFAPDGRTLALLDGRGIRLEDLQTGNRLADYVAPDVNCELTDRGCTTQTLVFAPDGRTLATGHLDGTILLWKVPRLRNAGLDALAEGQAEKLWKDLGNSSPSTARAAIERLAAHPDKAVSLLAARFRPHRTSDDGKLAALIKDLDSDDFATREEATGKLRSFGAKAEGALHRALVEAPSLEMKRRIEGILADLTPPSLRLPLTGDCLRGVRAIEVLERVGNNAARKALQSWAEQTENMQLAVEAQMALERRAPTEAKPRPVEKSPSP